jgi:predicted RNA-binding protein with TRAM domain
MFFIPESLKSVYTTELRERDGHYVLEVPKREIEKDVISVGAVYRVGVMSTRAATPSDHPQDDEVSRQPSESNQERGQPVEEGERLVVTIEHMGSRGDGIAKIDGGFVVVVLNTKPGDQPLIEISRVKETVAFGVPLDR